MPNVSARGFARSVQSRQRLVHVIAGRVDGTGTASILEGSHEFSLTDNGVGDYTLTFATPFAATPVVLVSALGAALASHSLAAVSASAVQINFWDAAGAALDVDFQVLIWGKDSVDEV